MAVTTTPSTAIGVILTILMAIVTTAHTGMVDLAGGMDGMGFTLHFTTLLTTMDMEAITTIDHHITTTYPTIVADETATI